MTHRTDDPHDGYCGFPLCGAPIPIPMEIVDQYGDRAIEMLQFLVETSCMYGEVAAQARTLAGMEYIQHKEEGKPLRDVHDVNQQAVFLQLVHVGCSKNPMQHPNQQVREFANDLAIKVWDKTIKEGEEAYSEMGGITDLKQRVLSLGEKALAKMRVDVNAKPEDVQKMEDMLQQMKRRIRRTDDGGYRPGQYL